MSRTKYFCENQRCRQLQSIGSRRRPFVLPGARPRYAPDLLFKLEHLTLNLKIDPFKKTLLGRVSKKIKVNASGQKWLDLDQVGLKIKSASINEKSVSFEIVGSKLRVFPNSSLPQKDFFQQDRTFKLDVSYEAENPQRGLYFTGPDPAYPNKPHQVWSQGEDEDSRYWFPSFDYPNQKSTSEMIVTVPEDYLAISNGNLVSKKNVGGGIEFHYRMEVPHVVYLVSLVVGQFSSFSDLSQKGLSVQYFVAKGKEKQGQLAFQNTSKMIEVFEGKIGVNYPYVKYSQVAVQDFIFGGMENISATTQSDLTLHDERAHYDFSSDPLVAHELAHQWFGDLLTCRDWSHAWLNEGFATFMERIWIEFNPSPEFETLEQRADEAKYYSYMDLKEYLEEDSSQHRRSLVFKTYEEPMDLFDRHLYQKGGLVLNLLRFYLGEVDFWKAINTYVTRHQVKNVETHDLIQAIEDATGKNPRLFFDEWVFGAGHPEFELQYQWHENRKLAELIVEQKQTGGKSIPQHEDGVTTHLFHVPVCIDFSFETEKKEMSSKSFRVDLSEARDRFFFEVPSQPKMVRFDPDSWIPKTIKFPRPKEMLLFQLKNDKDCMGRISAAEELLKIVGDPEIFEALGNALKQDSFWGVQFEIAEGLGQVRGERARNALLQGLNLPNSKSRTAVVRALGRLGEQDIARTLKPLAESDPSYSVEAQATLSWVKNFTNRQTEIQSEGLKRIKEFLDIQILKPSHRDIMASAVLAAMGEIPKIEKSEFASWHALILEKAQRGYSLDLRISAIRILGKILKAAAISERLTILKALDSIAHEEDTMTRVRIRISIVSALVESELREAIPILQFIFHQEIDSRVKRNAKIAITALGESGGETHIESIRQLKSNLEKLEEDHRKLRSIVEEFKSSAKGVENSKN